MAEYARVATGKVSGPEWERMVASQMQLFNEKDAKTVTDGDYILADRAVVDGLTMWGHFENENNQLQLTHCRAQREGDPSMLFIPVGSCYISDVIGPISTYYQYGCVPSTPGYLGAVVSTYGCAKTGPFSRCDRIKGSQWCGLPNSIGQSKQCMADYKKLLGQKQRQADGSIPFNEGEPFNGDTVYASFRCEANKLVLERCRAVIVDIIPGEYQANSKRFYVCPNVGPLKTDADMKNLEGRLRAVAKGDPILRQLKPKLPKEFQNKCAKDWETMTDDGERSYDLDEATVTIAFGGRLPKEQRTKGKRRYPDLVAKFSCDTKTDKLKLEFCVHQEDDDVTVKGKTHLSLEKCRKEDKEKEGALAGV